MTEAILVDCGINLCVNGLVCLTESAVSETGNPPCSLVEDE